MSIEDVKALIHYKGLEMAGYAMTQSERDIVEKFKEELLNEIDGEALG